MPLRVSGSLLLGVVRIFSHKVKYLSTDCDLALSKMKMVSESTWPWLPHDEAMAAELALTTPFLPSGVPAGDGP